MSSFDARDRLLGARLFAVMAVMSRNWIGAIAETSRVAPFQLFVVAVCAWLHRERIDLIAFLREENRVLSPGLAAGACVSTTASDDASANWGTGWAVACSRGCRRLSPQTRFSAGIVNWSLANGPTEARVRAVVVCKHTSEPRSVPLQDRRFVTRNFARAPFAVAERRFGGWVESEQHDRVFRVEKPLLKSGSRRRALAAMHEPSLHVWRAHDPLTRNRCWHLDADGDGM